MTNMTTSGKRLAESVYTVPVSKGVSLVLLVLHLKTSGSLVHCRFHDLKAGRETYGQSQWCTGNSPITLQKHPSKNIPKSSQVLLFFNLPIKSPLSSPFPMFPPPQLFCPNQNPQPLSLPTAPMKRKQLQ